MPIYEYKCNNCDCSFETLVLGGDKPSCPSCKSLDLSRLISKCGFVSKSIDSSGQPTVTASTASACSGCTATSCSSCTSG